MSHCYTLDIEITSVYDNKKKYYIEAHESIGKFESVHLAPENISMLLEAADKNTLLKSIRNCIDCEKSIRDYADNSVCNDIDEEEAASEGEKYFDRLEKGFMKEYSGLLDKKITKIIDQIDKEYLSIEDISKIEFNQWISDSNWGTRSLFEEQFPDISDIKAEVNDMKLDKQLHELYPNKTNDDLKLLVRYLNSPDKDLAIDYVVVKHSYSVDFINRTITEDSKIVQCHPLDMD